MPIDRLENIPGVGLKTSRYFKLYTDPDTRHIPLDTHLLKLLRDLGYEDVPTSTPSSIKKYKKHEDSLINEFEKSSFSRICDFDLAIWTAYSSGRPEEILDKLKNYAQV